MGTCKHGHPKTPENWVINSQGYGRCLVCARESERLRRQMAENAKHRVAAGVSEAGQPLYTDDRPSTEYIDNEVPLPF